MQNNGREVHICSGSAGRWDGRCRREAAARGGGINPHGCESRGEKIEKKIFGNLITQLKQKQILKKDFRILTQKNIKNNSI